MSLELLNQKNVKWLFRVLEYKHLAKFLLALDELKSPSTLADIANCFAFHRQVARYSSLVKTVKTALELDLVEGKKEYELTNLGRERTEFLKKAILNIVSL